MKHLETFLCLALAFTATACMKEKSKDPSLDGRCITEIEASWAKGDLKTSLSQDGTTIFWDAHDEINVFYNGETVKFISTNTEPKASTIFKAETAVLFGGSEGSGQQMIYAVYPYDAQNSQDGEVLGLSVPSTQKASAGSFAKGAFPSVGRSQTTSIAFYNVCGGLKFTLSQSDIRKIEFESLNSTNAIAGKAEVIIGSNEEPGVSKIVSGTNKITLQTPDGSAFETGKSYFISMLPCNLDKGFKMNFYKHADFSETGTAEFSQSAEVKRAVFGILDNIDKDVIFTPIEPEHTRISALCEMATTSETSFSVKVKDVVVTCTNGNYAHLQDDSGAILVYMKSHPLSTGDVLSGQISGKIKLYNGKTTVGSGEKAYAEITSIDISKAAKSYTGELPYIEASFADVNTNIEKYYNARVLFKNVTITTGISPTVQTGYAAQNGSSLMIFNKAKAATISTGVQGNLIAYPTIFYSGTSGKIELLVYTTDQFTEKEPEPVDPTPFTKLSNYGYYTGTDTENPAASFSYIEGSDQIATGKKSTLCYFNIVNPAEASASCFSINSTSVLLGSTYTVDCTKPDGSNESRSMTAVWVAGKKAWLEDKTNHIGYIIGIE